jgi:hypothetical protein
MGPPRRRYLQVRWFKRFGEERFEQAAPAMVAVGNKFYGVVSGTEQLWDDDLSPALTRSFSSPM